MITKRLEMNEPKPPKPRGDSALAVVRAIRRLRRCRDRLHCTQAPGAAHFPTGLPRERPKDAERIARETAEDCQKDCDELRRCGNRAAAQDRPDQASRPRGL